MMKPAVSFIIVTHNSEMVIDTCLDYLNKQTVPQNSIVVVDSGSTSTSYLEKLKLHAKICLIKTSNVGYAKGNNLGYEAVAMDESGLVVFMNPDTFLPEGFTDNIQSYFTRNPNIDIVSGKLFQFDIERKKVRKRLDSTGIYRKWYGRWYDRGQGQLDSGEFDTPESPPALCGALLVCKKSSLQKLGAKVFEEEFFLYKEDIEFCLRASKKGLKLRYEPSVIAYHGRGWQQDRSQMSSQLKLAAARSEILLYKKHPSKYILWAYCKYLLVKFLRL